MQTSFKTALEKVMMSYEVGFHVPGHNRGKLFKTLGYSDVLNYQLDTTEIPGTDNLHHAEGIIKAGQERASQFFKSEASFFLVNGSTCGNYAMMMSACKPGDTIIVGRDSHRSVYNGIMLGNLNPVYLYPQIRKKDQLPLGYSPKDLEALLVAYPKAKAVLITRPNYYGVCSDIKAIADICKRHGVLLLVDEAHGAHLNLHSELPCSAVEAGADMVVQSIHKTLPALTQASLLHVCSKRVDQKRLRLMLQIHQSSSPSYILMNSIDQAVMIAAQVGKQRMEELKKSIDELHASFLNHSTIEVLGTEVDGFERDFTKLLISAQSVGLSGSELEAVLRRDYSIQMEMSNLNYAVGIATIGHDQEDFKHLMDGLSKLVSKEQCSKQKALLLPIYPKYQEIGMSMGSSLYGPSETLHLEAAVGRLSKEFMIPYPPGIPLLVPGERITQELVAYVKQMQKMNHQIIGMTDRNSSQIDVVIEEA